MKKTLSVFLSILFAVIVVSTVDVCVFAQGKSALSSKSAKAGEVVTLTLSASGCEKAQSGAVKISLPEGITAKDGKWLIEPLIKDFDKDRLIGVFAFDGESDVNTDIIELTFGLSDDLPDGEYEIGCELMLKDASGESLDVACDKGTITVSKEVHISDDGEKGEDGGFPLWAIIVIAVAAVAVIVAVVTAVTKKKKNK